MIVAVLFITVAKMIHLTTSFYQIHHHHHNLEEEKKIVVHFVSHENFNRIYKIILFTEVFKFPRISIIF